MGFDLENAINVSTGKNNKIECRKLIEFIYKEHVQIDTIKSYIDKNYIRIKNCRAGEFGKNNSKYFSQEIFNKLKPYIDNKDRIECSKIFELAEDYGFDNVASTIKNSSITVIYCLFGCFREKSRTRLKARINVWIDNKSTGTILDKTTLNILKLIDKYGSISKAALDMGISYKKAWRLIKLLENNMGQVYVLKSRGRVVGGSKLTKDAQELISRFERLNDDIEEFADRRFNELFYQDRIKK